MANGLPAPIAAFAGGSGRSGNVTGHFLDEASEFADARCRSDDEAGLPGNETRYLISAHTRLADAHGTFAGATSDFAYEHSSVRRRNLPVRM